MVKSISAYVLVLAAVLTFAIFSSYTGEDNSSKQNNATTSKGTGESLPQVIKPMDLNRAFSFAGEALPMDNFDVKERLDMELMRNSYYHSKTIVNIKRANRFFPVIERILAEEGVPDDLKYLAVAESDLSNATSPAGAKGVWQFMKKTGQSYGLQVSKEIDERYHLEKSTRAACKYLKKLKARFGSWTLAAAAYNMGGTRLNKEKSSQRESNYFDLNLNRETSKYVFRIVALKEILSRPNDFGFYIADSELYPPLDNYNSVEVNTSIANWGDFAKKYNVSYRMLKVYNPWLTAGKLTNNAGKSYTIHIPK